jgi:hypothetical protein
MELTSHGVCLSVFLLGREGGGLGVIETGAKSNYDGQVIDDWVWRCQIGRERIDIP